VSQVARNLVMVSVLFDAVLADAGIAVVLSGVQIPRMNSIMEHWVRTCRRELLDRTLIFNQRHLLHALREYERFYNIHRPYQGIGNARPLAPCPTLSSDVGNSSLSRIASEGHRSRP
jgi:hypothetical protein